MIQATEPLHSPFLRVSPTEWEHKHLEPLSPAESEVMSMLVRVLSRGWGPRDRLAGKRKAVEIRPSLLSKHGARFSARTYRRALTRLMELGLVEVISTHRNARSVRPGRLWKTRNLSGCCPAQNRGNVARSSPLPSAPERTEDVKNKTMVQSTPVLSKPSPKKRPLRFRESECNTDRQEFQRIVGQLWKVNKRENPYKQANALLREHRLSFLLPIYREASSPTSGIGNPLGWIRVVVNRRGNR